MAVLTEGVVAAASAGEPAALRQVYDVLAPTIIGYLRSHGSEHAEDLAQDVFVALLPRLAKLHGGVAGLRTLAFSIAHARLVDEARGRTRRPPATTYEADADPRVVASAEEDVVRRVQEDALVGLLGELNEDQRTVVTLRVVAGLSLEETAAVIGKSVGAVKQLQRRGLLALRELVHTRQDVTR